MSEESGLPIVDPRLRQSLSLFVPPLPEEKVEEALAELAEIISEYRNIATKRLILAPFQRWNEGDEKYQERAQTAFNAPRRRGRPAYDSQVLFVLRLRDLLLKHGCKYGLYKDEGSSPLLDLIHHADLIAGMPKGDMDWASLAGKCVDPLFELNFLTGGAIVYPKAHSTLLKRALSMARVKPGKRKK